MKKTLAILLSLALVLCMMPGAAFANTTTPTTTPPVDLATATVTVTNNAVTYNGSAQYPTVVVKVGETTLTETTDYKVAYKQGETAVAAPTDAGEYSIVVTGTAAADATTGGYTGTVTASATHVISAYNLTGSTKYSVSVGSQLSGVTTSTFNMDTAKFFENGIELTGLARNNFLANIDLKSIADNKVTFTGKKNFTGTLVSEPFETATDISTLAGNVVITNPTYNGYDFNLYDYVKIKNAAGNGYLTNYDYEISPATVKNAGTHSITIKGKGAYASQITGKTISVAKKASSQLSVTVTGALVDGRVTADVKVYDSVLGKYLTAGTDYVLHAPVKVGSNGNYKDKYSVTIEFRTNDNYDKDIIREFEVANAAYDVSSLGLVATGLTATTAPYYSGSAQEPTVTVKKPDGSLFTNYDLVYKYRDAKNVEQSTYSPVDAKTYSVYLEGTYPYSGQKYIGNYTITQVPIEWATATASAGYTTTKPNVVVKSIVSGVVFKETTDYTVYSWNSTYTNKTYVTVTSTKTGNLGEGTLEAEFSMVGKNLAYCTAEFATGSKQYNNYTGSAIKPAIRVRDGYTVLTAGSDYTVTYKDAAGKVVAAPKDAGTYTIEITGKGAYSGTINMYFYINGTDISSYTVTLKADSVKADGLAKTPVISSVKYGFYSTLSSADYTVTYEDPQGNTVTAYSIKAPGTYKVIVTGKGGYSGSTYAYFTVVGTPQEISIPKTSYKVYKDSDSFTIKATATGDGTGFSYVSSDPTVASVSSTGKVTIHKLGRAKITVTTTGMKKSDPASDDVYVKVYPDKGTLSQKPWTEGKKGSLRVRWDKQDDVTYYEVRYSRDKSFKSGSYKTKKVTASTLSYDTQSTRLTGLKSGSKYYVKVRAVKEVKNDYGQTLKYYGTWSNWRSATTK